MADAEEVVEADVTSPVVVKKVRPVRRRLVRENDLPGPLLADIIEYAEQAMDDEANNKQKNLAQYVKQKLDTEKGGTWHVICGAHFGGNITNDAGTLVNFQLGANWFLVFRSGPPEKASTEAA